MNSKIMKCGALIAAMGLISNTQAAGMQGQISHRQQHRSEGIFGRMIDQVTAGERFNEERHEATKRKEQQLAEAEE